MPVIKGNARTPVGMKMASKTIKDGCSRDVVPRKEVGGPYNNPSKVVIKGIEHKIGKLG